MDLLSQYNKDHPEASLEKKAASITDEYGRVYTGMIALVMRLSGGSIRDARTASYVLLAASAIIILGALVILFWPSRTQNALPKNFETIDQSQYANPR